MNKFHAKKIAKQKKLKLSDGHRHHFVTQKELQDICGYSRSHAYRIITGQYDLPDQLLELLKIKLLGTLPDWPQGWHLIGGTITSPSGYRFDSTVMENYLFYINLLKELEHDLRALAIENAKLKEQVKNRTELRVYVNDGKTPERTIKLVKG